MSTPPTLLTLPPELRNKITELAVYHTQTDGVISPRPFAWLNKSYVILIKGFRIQSTRSPTTARSSTLAVLSNQPTPELDIWLHDNENEEATAASFRLACVNRRWHLRAEVLPVFYGMHHFHIELDQFRRFDGARNINNSVDGWLRGIGDTNLRYIRRFTIAAPASTISGPVGETIQLRYTRPRKQLLGQVAIERVSLDLATPPVEPEKTHWDYGPGLSREAFLVALQESGLHVRALECLIASFDGALQDYSALEVGDYAEEDAKDFTGLREMRMKRADG